MNEPLLALDMRTLALLLVGLGAVSTAIFLGLWRQGPGGRPALLWGLGHALGGLSYLLLGLRGVAPDWLSIVVANTALHVAAYLLLIGTALFVGHRLPHRLILLLLAAEALALVHYTFVERDLVMRIVLASAVGGGLLLATGVTFLHNRRQDLWGTRSLAAGSFAFVGAALLLRGGVTLAYPPSSEHFLQVTGLIQASSMALLLLGGVIWALVLVWLIADAWYNDRLEEARAREKTEAALRESEQRFRTIFEQSANAVAFGDESGRILLANRAFYDLLGYELGELEGLSFTDLTHPDDLPHEQELLRELLKRGHDHYRLEKRYLAKNGSSVWVDLIVSAVRADDGSPLHFIGVATDIRDKRAAQAELEFRATYDPLTGAVNRLAFEQYLEVEQNRTERYGEPSCLVMFDIDHFKPINDTYGHQAGDGVLATLAQRVQERLRASDILGRWGGEEFMVLLPKTGRPGGLRVAETLRRAVAGTTFPTVGRVTISLGVAELRSDESFTELLMRVDDAMYAAKEGGRNRVARAGEAGAAPQIVDGDERGRPGESRTAPGA